MKTSIMERIAPKLVHAPTIMLERQLAQYDELVRSGQINLQQVHIRTQLREGADICRKELAKRARTSTGLYAGGRK